MSSAFPPDSSHSRTWWSFSPKQPQLPLQDPHKPYSSYKSPNSPRSGGLHSIVAALGFKSKKHATIAVRDTQHSFPRPHLPAINTSKPASSDPSLSPPSRSTPSGIDSVGPHTPFDSQQRPSFDNDPFAARSPSSPYGSSIKPFPSLSNASSPDIRSKSRDLIPNRPQRAPSHSNTFEGGPSPSRRLHPSASDSRSSRKPKESTGSLHRKRSLAAVDRSIGSVVESFTSQPSIYKSTSSTTLTEKNRLSQPEPTLAPRPPMRARGMTDSGPNQRFTSNETVIPTFPQTSPPLRVIIRQPSVSRIGLPPSAPPSHELPLPPPRIDEIEVPPRPNTSSASSSSGISFASSAPPERDSRHNSPRKKPLPVRPDDAESQGSHGVSRNSTPSDTPRTLKKAISYQSLGKKGQSSRGSTSPPLDSPGSHKSLQKQRSFHQSKASSIFPPIPPLTKLNGASGSTASSETSPVEQRRGSSSSGISLPTRKRLFSGSSLRRPSTSQCIMSDDDARSMFSVQSESEQSAGKSFEPLQRHLSPTTTMSSCWDEFLSDIPQSPSYAAQDYTPQKIMSSAEIAELSANLERPVVSGRERGFSILSASTTVTSDGEDERMSKAGRSSGSAASSIYGETSTSSVTSAGSPVRKMFSSDRAPFRLSIFRSGNETTEQPIADQDTQKPKALKPSPPAHPLTSLPPPPRRSRTQTLLVSEEPLPTLPSVTALGRKFVRPKVSVEKILHRRSLMKKPSFLEIDDDTDGKDTDVEGTTEPQTGSFLDLARDSIDTMASINE